MLRYIFAFRYFEAFGYGASSAAMFSDETVATLGGSFLHAGKIAMFCWAG